MIFKVGALSSVACSSLLFSVGLASALPKSAPTRFRPGKEASIVGDVKRRHLENLRARLSKQDVKNRRKTQSHSAGHDPGPSTQEDLGDSADGGHPTDHVLCTGYVVPEGCEDPFDGLLDPTTQRLFTELVPNALEPSFVNNGVGITGSMCRTYQETGIIDPETGDRLTTELWGFKFSSTTGNQACSSPGPTLEAQTGTPTYVFWQSELPIYEEFGHLLTNKYSNATSVDTSLHWAYGIPGYTDKTLQKDGIPVVPHVHGAHTDTNSDGDPDHWFTQFYSSVGPCVNGNHPYVYSNDQKAAMLWYHDHALGITRLNVYSGLLGHYVLRDESDTGKPCNAYDLPTYPYEVALAIQDRMYKKNGELFYPAFYCEPAFDDFITENGACPPLDENKVPQATALAEFFGNFMTVNGKIWPKMDLEPRNYRLRFINGCDSRYLVITFCIAESDSSTVCSYGPLPFTIIGVDQGLGPPKRGIERFVMEPGSRYDIIFDFSKYASSSSSRILMRNHGGDEPFGGEIPGPQVFDYTDRIMAFDVTLPLNTTRIDGMKPRFQEIGRLNDNSDKYLSDDIPLRRVGLFEGSDSRGRLMPLLGTVGFDDPALDGTLTWDRAITETPELNSVEEWEVWNLSEDAHPVHLHLVWVKVVGRNEIKTDKFTLTEIPLLHHENATAGEGTGYRVTFDGSPEDAIGRAVDPNADEQLYIEEGMPRDVFVALPGQVTRIRMKFDKPGRFAWHCHLLSHEDHEMMRLFRVGEGDGC